MQTHDILISGAGPVGCVLALLLAQLGRRPQRIAVLAPTLAHKASSDSMPSANSGTNGPDPRALALNHGSRVLLDQLQAWPKGAANITTVHVSQRGHFGRTLIQASDMQVSCLGSVVAYDTLMTTLHQRLKQTGVDLIPEAAIDISNTQGAVQLRLHSMTLKASVAVHSDGKPVSALQRPYGQHAVLTSARAEQTAQGWAYERFTRDGPLALLPHPEGMPLFSVIWCCPSAMAHELSHMSTSAFDNALNHAFGERLGTLSSVGPRHVFPLSLHAGPQLRQPQVIAIGNAAQTLHPVAGQGLNLGLRDAAQLAHHLRPWLTKTHTNVEPYLQQYIRQRRADRWLTMAITDALPRLFTTRQRIVDHACGLGLLGLDLYAPARRSLGRQLMLGLRS